MINYISDFVPSGTESGVGLALRDEQGRYIFFLAGTRHSCPPDEIFYAGLGGHREAGESWVDCAYREAEEEIGTDVKIIHQQRHGLSKLMKRLGRSQSRISQRHLLCMR